jgi:hypothetical protein
MTIWILALLILGSAISLGHRQGAIHAGFSFLGIMFAGLLAVPIGGLFKPLLPHLGVHNQTLIWMIAPIEGFAIILIAFKAAGFVVHRKVSVHYKHNAGDLQRLLWERLNARLGACVGALNGTAYLVLVCFGIFNLSYWTAQIASDDGETRTTRIVNKLGHDLQSTGMAKAAHAFAAMPVNYYKVADLAGLIAQNPDLSERLAKYPPFISLAERDDLQQLAQDADFSAAWQQHAPMGQLMNEPAVKNILQNNDLIDTVWQTLQTNLDDLSVYLKTGDSPKYDSEKILGRWDFNVNATVATLRLAQPNIPASQMRLIRAMWTQGFANTTFVAGSDGQAFLKNLPNFKAQPTIFETWKGTWTADDTNYDISLTSNGNSKPMTAQTDGLRLTLKDDKNTLIFDPEN